MATAPLVQPPASPLARVPASKRREAPKSACRGRTLPCGLMLARLTRTPPARRVFDRRPAVESTGALWDTPPAMGTFSAFVLAAGYGTRLRPLTEEIPKPLLPVGDEPLLTRTLRALHEAGAQDLWVNVHHQHDKIISNIESLPFSVHVSYEERILGTAGALARVRERLRPPLVLVNGDIVTTLPIEALLGAPVAALTLAVAAPASSAGTVGLDGGERVVRLRGEPFGEEANRADYIGVARIDTECLDTLPPEGCLIGDWALPWLRRGGSIPTVRSAAPFRDLGDPASYLAANLEWLGAAAYVAPGVAVPAGIELVSSSIGRGAVLGGAGVIRESVVLPGAHAQAPLHRSVVLPSGRVVAVA